MGKSSLALGIAINAAIQQEPVAIFSLEMSKEEIVQRILSSYIDDSPVVTVTDIRAKCRRLKRKKGLSLVVIDYLQLMESSNRENRQQEISEITRNLKNLARELEVPVIAVSQLNRSLETREDKRPRLSDLRESGSIEQDADVVMFIYRHEYYHPEDQDRKGIAEVIVAKHRAGSTGPVEVTFQPEFTRFANLGRDVT
jgi:replicative DNA helicase